MASPDVRAPRRNRSAQQPRHALWGLPNNRCRSRPMTPTPSPVSAASVPRNTRKRAGLHSAPQRLLACHKLADLSSLSTVPVRGMGPVSAVSSRTFSSPSRPRRCTCPSWSTARAGRAADAVPRRRRSGPSVRLHPPDDLSVLSGTHRTRDRARRGLISTGPCPSRTSWTGRGRPRAPDARGRRRTACRPRRRRCGPCPRRRASGTRQPDSDRGRRRGPARG